MGVMSGFDEVRQTSRTARRARSGSTHRGWRDATRTTLVVLETLLAIAATGGAIALATGALDLGDTAAELPFASPVFAAVALYLTNAALPGAVALGSLRRAPWADPGHVVVGVVLCGWILVQVAVIGWSSPLQTACLAYGLVIAGIGAWRLLDR